MSTPEEIRQIYEDYVLVFGREAQWKMVLEEALEYAHAALKLDRVLRRTKETDHVIFLPFAPSHPGWHGPEMNRFLLEAVDCRVMIGQLPWITGDPNNVLSLLEARHTHVVAKMKRRLKEEAGGE